MSWILRFYNSELYHGLFFSDNYFFELINLNNSRDFYTLPHTFFGRKSIIFYKLLFKHKRKR